MRELKFRVWSDGGWVSPDYIDREGYAHWSENSIPSSTKEIEFFIGIKDSKRTEEFPDGEEIYEGDIIEISSGKYIIMYDSDTACYCFSSRLMRPIFKMKDDDYFNMKIIGNIHEVSK